MNNTLDTIRPNILPKHVTETIVDIVRSNSGNNKLRTLVGRMTLRLVTMFQDRSEVTYFDLLRVLEPRKTKNKTDEEFLSNEVLAKELQKIKSKSNVAMGTLNYFYRVPNRQDVVVTLKGEKGKKYGWKVGNLNNVAADAAALAEHHAAVKSGMELSAQLSNYTLEHQKALSASTGQ